MPSIMTCSIHDNSTAIDEQSSFTVTDGYGLKDKDLCLGIGDLSIFISPGRLRQLHDVIGEALAKQPPTKDPLWCYSCDRPKNDCACHLDHGSAAPFDGSEFAMDENAAVKLLRSL